MKIKELENLLSISRSNIRFYEKQGLFSPERKGNNYREYTEQDIEVLKKIIVFRKMGFTVEEIKLIQNNELPFAEAITNVQHRIEDEIEQLNGSLKLIRQVSKESSSFAEVDVKKHWNNINESEKFGEKFVDICKDYLNSELKGFEFMWKFVFFYDFAKSRKKHGVLKASIIILIICIARGIASLYKNESFWYGFLYPFAIFLAGSILIFPLFLLSQKHPKIASFIANILIWISIIFLVCIFLLAIILLLVAIFT